MKALIQLALAVITISSNFAIAEVPYKIRDGIEEVDYAKLNPIRDFKLPDSGQNRETTWVKGEDGDYERHPMSFSISDDGEIVVDNNTGLMWERHLNWQWDKTVPPKGKWRPQDVFGYQDGEPKRRLITKAYSTVSNYVWATMMIGACPT